MGADGVPVSPRRMAGCGGADLVRLVCGCGAPRGAAPCAVPVAPLQAESELKHRNLNLLGRYSFTASVPAASALRPLRDPEAPELDEDDGGGEE
ncbi:hypothetical protein M2167_007516 [Streptomyces sp. SPB4]|nr:hypothetical protein [Streptomyces sp. SPB4]